MTTLSCCLIVRDAESTLSAALLSAAAHVDELVVVDTGSTDRTCEIAAEFADVLVGYQWCDDFSAARNFALDHCTGDWVMWLDADDELVNGELLRPLVEATPDEVGMLLMRYVLDRAPDGTPTFEYWRERVCRRDLCRWQGRVHEVLMPTQQTGYKRIESVHVQHRKRGGGAESLKRNVALRERSLAEDPDNTRTMFYLGRDLIEVGEVDRGVELLERYITLGSWPDEQHIAAQLVADCHRRAGRYSEALGTDAACILLHPEWPHTWYALAKDAYFLQRWEWSVRFCEIGQSCPPPETNLFISPAALSFDWMIYQVRALSMIGRLEDALSLTLRALAIRPGDALHAFNARYLTGELLARAGLGVQVAEIVPEAAP